MSIWTWLWIAWIASGVVIEGVALVNTSHDKAGDTLSEHLWAWLGIARWQNIVKGVRPVKSLWALRVVFLGAMVWFIVHILTGGAM